MDPATIIAGISALSHLARLISETVSERRRSGVLTPEESAAWREFVEARMKADHWSPPPSPPTVDGQYPVRSPL